MIGEDRGAGSVLAITLMAAVSIAALAVVSGGGALVARQRVVGAADAAALGAADALSGAVPGDPCDLATRVAAANRAALGACALDGLVATVEVSGGTRLLPVRVRSTAGPPP